MSAGGIRYDAMIVREYETNGETRSAWMRAGSAFVNKDGSIGLALDVVPTDWSRSKIILQVPKTEEEIEALKAAKGFHGSGKLPQRRQGQPQQQSFQPPQARAPRAPKKTPDYPPQWDDEAAAGQEAPGFADEDQP